MLEDNPLVSIIIPFYNTEAYLRECLNSIINQTYTNLEIILVDDGSTDKSGEIAQEYAKRDVRVSYIRQENAGAGNARNRGLSNARGEWIYFIDSDDYIDKSYIEELVWISEKDNIIINFNVLFNFMHEVKRFNRYKTIKGKFILSYNIITLFDFFVCNCLLLKSIIDKYNIRFISGKICEDAWFLYQILPFVKSIICIDSRLYYYRQWSDSATGKLAQDELVSCDRLDIFAFLTKWYKKYCLIKQCGLPFIFYMICIIAIVMPKIFSKKQNN